jgi:hypothetical protein
MTTWEWERAGYDEDAPSYRRVRCFDIITETPEGLLMVAVDNPDKIQFREKKFINIIEDHINEKDDYYRHVIYSEKRLEEEDSIKIACQMG